MNEETQEKSAVVLTRRAGEAIRLGDDVFVRVG
ncbi:carbon storage regulator [Bythopirellula goksoeyrii]|nr:carbon storage regulator [Bythopirellula goksoeyrii]